MQLKINKNALTQLNQSSFPDVLSVQDIRKILGIGRISVYHLIEMNRIQAFQKGRSYLIPKQSVAQFLLNYHTGDDKL